MNKTICLWALILGALHLLISPSGSMPVWVTNFGGVAGLIYSVYFELCCKVVEK